MSEAFDVLTPDQVAAALHLPRRTVLLCCARGDLPGARKAGRQWRIPSTALAAFFRVEPHAGLPLETPGGGEGAAQPLAGGGLARGPGARQDAGVTIYVNPGDAARLAGGSRPALPAATAGLLAAGR